LGGFVEYNNLKVKCPTTNPIRLIQVATAAAGQLTVVAKNCDFEGNECIMGNGKKFTAIGCNFKNSDPAGAGNFTFDNQNPTTQGEAYFIDCNFQLVNTGGEVFRGFAPVILGCAKTIGSEVLGDGAVDTYGDYSVIPTLELPNIEL
jgi:hypothetical protein